MLKFFKIIFLVITSLLPVAAYSQTITLTSPLVNLEVNEGDDFATQVLKNPWDFTERRDIGWEEFFTGSSVGVSSGIWSGTYAGGAGKSYVFPLFPGFANTSVLTNGIEGDRSMASFGAVYPIDSTKYNLLTFMGSHDKKELETLFWNTDPTGGNPQGSSPEEFWPDGTQFCVHTNEVALQKGSPVSGWQARHFNLANLTSTCDAAKAGAWSGNIIALRIDASATEVAGNITRYDWMRLVDPSSAPNLTLTWTSAGINTGTQFISVYLDNNSSGLDGREYMVVSGDPGTITFPTASLPPGDWYFYLVVRNKTTLATVANSAYSARLRVNKAPIATFSAPTQVSGRDFATRELLDPWDFASMSDAANVNTTVIPYNEYVWKQFFGESVSTGALTAFADDPQAGNTETDAQVHLNLGNNLSDLGGVDSGAYRYLAFDLFIDPTLYPTISDKIAKGFVTRIAAWQNLPEFGQRFAPKLNIIYEGMHRYYIDLHDFDVAEKNVFPLTSAWLEKEIWSHLRLDPQETGFEGPTAFSLDNVNLYTENYSEDQEYEIAWDIEDNDATSNISIYYDNDNSGFNGTLITTLNNVPKGAGNYTWNTSGLTEGARYYVYLVIDDGVNISRYYSPVPIIIGPPAVATSQVLNSPLYALWNSFLGMRNILELVNKGSDPLNVNLTFYRIDGSIWHSLSKTLSPTGQFDFILNDLPNFPTESYGVVKIEFAGDKLDGRMSFYRDNPAGAGIGDMFEYVFNEPFVNPLEGNSYVSFNTFQPSLNPADAANPVRNFLSIVNLHATAAKSFTVNRYNQSGGLVSTTQLTNVPPFGRRDIDGGHGDGANLVGYNEIIPTDSTAPYKAGLIRYGAADAFGFNYDFAFNLRAISERPTQQWVNVSIADGAQNWLEIVNTSNSSVNAEVKMFNYNGTQIHLATYTLAPRSQRHVEIGSFLNDLQHYGAVRILASQNNALIAQNMFYVRDATGSVRAMYGYHAGQLYAGEQSSSWNLFLGMNNDLHFFNASSSSSAQVRLMVGNNSKEKERTYTLGPRSGVAVELSENLNYGTVSNNYGVVRLHGRALVANSSRIRADAAGSYDFITPVDVRP